jgi:DNA-binding winged helix-turn-helix (wHTH) protein/tetratricopeptide (TPR) repeat protein
LNRRLEHLNESTLKSGLLLYDRAQVTEETQFQFDGWTLHPRSGELLRDGNVQRLPQQPLRVLVELLSHPAEVVTRDRLVQVLWPKGVVDFDNSLNAVVRKLRAVLGDDSETPRYIETLPRIGYRFIAKLQPLGSIAAPVAPLTPAAPAEVPAEIRRVKRRHIAAAAIAVLAGVAALLWWPRTPRLELPMHEAGAVDTEPRRTSNQRAYELYLNGKFHRSRRDISGNSLALQSFEAALKEDPYFVDAWGALSETYTGAGITQQMPVVDAMEKARAAALRAIELDSKSPSGHAALAVIEMNYDLDYAGAEREFQLAKAADESYGRLWHGWGLLRGYQGRVEEAYAYLGRARELEPMTLLYSGSYANLLYHTRRYGEAIEYARSLLASQPRFDGARAVLIHSLIATDDVKGALEQLPLRFQATPVLGEDGLVYAHAGRRADALQQIERLERRAREGFGLSYEIAIIYAALGEKEKGCEALLRSLTDHSQLIGWMKLDPRMDPLRAEPCFAQAQARLLSN